MHTCDIFSDSVGRYGRFGIPKREIWVSDKKFFGVVNISDRFNVFLPLIKSKKTTI